MLLARPLGAGQIVVATQQLPVALRAPELLHQGKIGLDVVGDVTVDAVRSGRFVPDLKPAHPRRGSPRFRARCPIQSPGSRFR
jgi:hypothetical protein